MNIEEGHKFNRGEIFKLDDLNSEKISSNRYENKSEKDNFKNDTLSLAVNLK